MASNLFPYIRKITMGKNYRTASKAGNVAKIPDKIPVITYSKYQNAISCNGNPTAYLQPLMSNENLDYVNGIFYLNGSPIEDITSLYSNERIDSVNLPLLRLLFAIILERFKQAEHKEKYVPEVISIYYPDLEKKMGKSSNASQESRASLIKDILHFSTVLGILKAGSNILPVLDILEEDPEKNTIQFSSPYLTQIIRDIYTATNKHKNTIKPEQPCNESQTCLGYSYLAHSNLAIERNKNAVEIVCIVLRVIEQTGAKGTPHISAKTILNRNPQLLQSIDHYHDRSNKNKLLSHAFSKAWELLRTKTDVEKKNKNIQLPNTDQIPTMGKLDMTFSFPHEGIEKRKTPAC